MTDNKYHRPMHARKKTRGMRKVWVEEVDWKWKKCKGKRGMDGRRRKKGKKGKKEARREGGDGIEGKKRPRIAKNYLRNATQGK
jgi:hypothetical protein